MDAILTAAKSWLSDFFDTEVKNEIQQLIANDPEGLKDRFYKNMEFGTGGMRGLMGVGTNRINKYTLGKSTQGLSNYLKKVYSGKEIRVVIAYDCRHNSDTLAKTVANVFSANGIKVFLFSELRTTPELSFAVRHLDCHAGIVLTASHNPPEYNGYKVYWTDGGQIVPPQDGAIISAIENLAYEDINFNANEDLIEMIDTEVDEAFMNASVANGNFNAAGKDDPLLKWHPLYQKLGVTCEHRQFCYRELFNVDLNREVVHDIRQALSQELVLGRSDFKEMIEKAVVRQVRPGVPGRPRVKERSERYHMP